MSSNPGNAADFLSLLFREDLEPPLLFNLFIDLSGGPQLFGK